MSQRHDIHPRHPIFGGPDWRMLRDSEVLTATDETARISLLFSLEDPEQWQALGGSKLVGQTVKHACEDSQDGDGEERVFRRKTHEAHNDGLLYETEYGISINGRKYNFNYCDISYRDVVMLEGGEPDPKKHVYSIVYHHGHHSKPEGILAPGDTVTIANGMVFRMTTTGNS